MTAPYCLPGNSHFYLGKTPSPMIRLNPDSAYTNTLSQLRAVHALISGAQAVQHVDKVRRAYQLNFSAMTIDQADPVTSILAGLLGRGPYYLVDPNWRNLYPKHVSAAGIYKASSAGFIATGPSAVAYSAAVAPPAACALSGVQLWSGVATGASLYCNASASQILEGSAPPALTGEAITAGAWMRTVSGTVNVTMSVYFNTAAGAFISAVSVGTAALTTTFTRFAGTLAAASIPATAATFGVVYTWSSGTATGVYLAGLDAQLITASVGTTFASLPPWVLGLGVPRVNISADSPGGPNPVYWRRGMQLNLVEAT